MVKNKRGSGDGAGENYYPGPGYEEAALVPIWEISSLKSKILELESKLSECEESLKSYLEKHLEEIKSLHSEEIKFLVEKGDTPTPIPRSRN